MNERDQINKKLQHEQNWVDSKYHSVIHHEVEWPVALARASTGRGTSNYLLKFTFRAANEGAGADVYTR